MDDDSRSKKKPFYGALKSAGRGPHSDSRMYDRDRRQLKAYDLKQPDYNIKPQYLIDDNVEKYVYFAGVINDIAPHTDITNRTDVLRIIDKGKQQGSIVLHSTRDKLAVFSLSVNNVKLIPCSSEDLPIYLRIPMQEIAAICYIKDDGQHILAIKHGSTELCHLAVLYCESKPAAEEICALVDQCFQLIYMDAVFNIIDTSNAGDSSHSDSTGSANQLQPSFITTSLQELNISSRQSSIRRVGRRIPSEPSTRDSDGSISNEELCRDYMIKLHQKLNAEELRTFASLLPELSSKTHFGEFCEKVLELYGPERKYLLSEMSPFIPSDNYPQFEDFLRRNGLALPDSGTLSSTHSNPVIYSRSVSDISGSTIANGNESLEHIMRIMSDVHRMDESNDVDINPDHFMPGIDYN
ncbi:cerebral cavernous malformations protein 2 homolog [Patella vulgata]|uniref:cerebral cavernous malformations protein 2 homolog n=1 Tax=Patella vulgata TaxID=6465 RepID=UPI0021808C7B|nr:cerebral cavernous malformations protein 2 homolog [Patella vulgata]